MALVQALETRFRSLALVEMLCISLDKLYQKIVSYLAANTQPEHTHTHVGCTWPTISGIPKARSISCRAPTSAVLSRESSWSNNALSSLWPSLLVRGPNNSSKGFPNWSLPRKIELLSHFNTSIIDLLTRQPRKFLPACVSLRSINPQRRTWP